MEDLLNSIQGVGLSNNIQDKVWQKYNTNGCFTVKSFSNEWRAQNQVTNNVKGVWMGMAPPRTKPLVWFVIQEKLNMRSRLHRLNLIIASKTYYPFCNSGEETMRHLFLFLLHCEFSWKTWMNVLNWRGIQILVTQTPRQWFDVWVSGESGGGFQKKLWISLCFVVFWSICNQRNRVIFDNVQTDWAQLCFLIRLRLGFWVKRWSPDCFYGPGEVAYKLECVKLWRKSKEQRTTIIWCPPPPNKFKWNVDGSSKGKPGPAGMAGLLRNVQGIIKALFAASVGILDSNEAEFVAIVFVLEMSLQKEWLKEKKFIVESDSKIALAYINRRE